MIPQITVRKFYKAHAMAVLSSKEFMVCVSKESDSDLGKVAFGYAKFASIIADALIKEDVKHEKEKN